MIFKDEWLRAFQLNLSPNYAPLSNNYELQIVQVKAAGKSD